eukprot:2227789-Pleurochrysis_carterae.AAC.1
MQFEEWPLRRMSANRSDWPFERDRGLRLLGAGAHGCGLNVPDCGLRQRCVRTVAQVEESRIYIDAPSLTFNYGDFTAGAPKQRKVSAVSCGALFPSEAKESASLSLEGTVSIR